MKYNDHWKKDLEVSDGASLGIALSIYNASNLEFLGFKSLRYVDTDAYLELLPSLCYLSGLQQILPVRTKEVKPQTTCCIVFGEKGMGMGWGTLGDGESEINN
ncbi:unnamed protein product [Dibothriocephalus latus]|uniref:Uncharacterized protein n=1 Tax=Dibothriocephalus latus TaxID=60516 RepID=A0A3P6SVK6_DIBLA|nr:unnamed protein product [Dibothriocephalus latus]